jgi:hypothetical protein
MHSVNVRRLRLFHTTQQVRTRTKFGYHRGFGIVRSNLILRWFMACKQLAVTATRSSVAGRSDSECTSIAANVGGRIQ